MCVGCERAPPPSLGIRRAEEAERRVRQLEAAASEAQRQVDSAKQRQQEAQQEGGELKRCVAGGRRNVGERGEGQRLSLRRVGSSRGASLGLGQRLFDCSPWVVQSGLNLGAPQTVTYKSEPCIGISLVCRWNMPESVTPAELCL